MTAKRETDPHSGTETTGHEWDGITELDTPLPRWWLWIFYGTIAFALGEWVLMPEQVDDLTEYVVALSHRPADHAAVGRAAKLYADNCAVCHGADGRGNQQFGAPNLTDRDWLYGGDRASIHDQIWNGRGGVMPNWGQRLDANTIKALTVSIHANAGGQ